MLRSVLWYRAVALGPLIVIGVLLIMIHGVKAKASPYTLILVFGWGLFWVNRLKRYVRSHPLPTDRG